MRQIVDDGGELGCADYVGMDRHPPVVRTPVQDRRPEPLMLIDTEVDIRPKHVAGQGLASPSLDIDDGPTHLRDEPAHDVCPIPRTGAPSLVLEHVETRLQDRLYRHPRLPTRPHSRPLRIPALLTRLPAL